MQAPLGRGTLHQLESSSQRGTRAFRRNFGRTKKQLTFGRLRYEESQLISHTAAIAPQFRDLTDTDDFACRRHFSGGAQPHLTMHGLLRSLRSSAGWNFETHIVASHRLNRMGIHCSVGHLTRHSNLITTALLSASRFTSSA